MCIRERYRTPLPVDTQTLEQWTHRLSGLACIINAPDLAKACLELESAAREAPHNLEAQRLQMLAVIEGLLRDIEHH